MAERDPHHCHAHGCTRNVPPKMLMCLKHWRMVPVKLQRAVWATYRAGQEIDKAPSDAYILAQRAAVWSVFVDEGGCKWPDVPEVGSTAFMIGPELIRRAEETNAE